MTGSGADADRGGASASEAKRLAEEHAALRRIAMLIARQTPQAEVFTAVAEELGRVLAVEAVRMLRFDASCEPVCAEVVGSSGPMPDSFQVGDRAPLGGDNLTTTIFETGAAARRDDYSTATGDIGERVILGGIKSAVGVPVMVEGQCWGVMLAAALERGPLPADTQPRLAQFGELMATAIANAEARAEVERLAEEQAALPRVATLVARGAAPNEVFEAAIVEVEALLNAAQVGLLRFEETERAAILAMNHEVADVLGGASSILLDGDSAVARVLATGRAARVEAPSEGNGTIAELARLNNIVASVAAPMTIEGKTWGVIAAAWDKGHPPSADAEARLAEFAELLGTAIANADSRDQLAASRARVLGAGDQARRRVVRDLHDGAQQRLVHTIVTLKLARQALVDDQDSVPALVDQALDQAQQGNEELRELAHGILPAALSRGGLAAGVDALVARLDLTVEPEVTTPRLAPEVEASAYFVVAEALTNVVKHSGATSARVVATVGEGGLRLEVVDDGRGGADAAGHGLLGLADRVEALGGRLAVESPAGGGTVVRAELPVSTEIGR